jgi:pimeloyl-ACP methyl ester carboxylesterase
MDARLRGHDSEIVERPTKTGPPKVALRRISLLGNYASTRERATASHRNAKGLALAARGMLTRRDARVMELLPDIKVPSLIVVGGDDTPFLAASDYMAAKIPGAQKIVIPADRTRRQHRSAAGFC